MKRQLTFTVGFCHYILSAQGIFGQINIDVRRKKFGKKFHNKSKISLKIITRLTKCLSKSPIHIQPEFP